jgi:hypothetical protein
MPRESRVRGSGNWEFRNRKPESRRENLYSDSRLLDFGFFFLVIYAFIMYLFPAMPSGRIRRSRKMAP